MSTPRSMSPVVVDRLRSVGPADSLGQRLVLVRQIGAGGMGRVYKATDPVSGRALAVKLIQQVRGDADLARFAAEAEILEALDHPAIVAYVSHGTMAEGDHYLAMAWLDGETLSQRLSRAVLSPAEAVALGHRIADGLAAAHRAGVIHRDLKPSNIVLVGGEVGRATLVDFGIARRSGGDGLTRTGELVGTPGYMAPEQVRGGREIDGRADLFALGCVLYQALTGHSAFGDEDIMTVLARLLLEEAPPVRALRGDVPPRLDALIGRLLAKDNAQRPALADEVVAELAAIGDAIERGDAAALSAPALPHSLATGVAIADTLVQPAPRRRARAAYAGIAAVAAAGGIGAVLVARPGDARPPFASGGSAPARADIVQPLLAIERDGAMIAQDVPLSDAGVRAGDRLRLRLRTSPGTWIRVDGREDGEWTPYFAGTVPGNAWLPIGITVTPDPETLLKILACPGPSGPDALEALVRDGTCQERTYDLR